MCDWWFKFECSRAPQLYNKGNQKPEDDLKNRITLSELSHITEISNEGIEPGAGTDVIASNPPLELSVGDVGQQTPYGRSARRLKGSTSSRGGAHVNVIQGSLIQGNGMPRIGIQGTIGSENTEFTNKKSSNHNLAASTQNSSSEGSILIFSELVGIVSDVGFDSDGEIFFISDDISNDTSLVIDTLNSRDTSEAFQQNRESAVDAQRSLGTSLFKERGITGFVPSHVFPLMTQNTNLFSVSPVP